MFKKIVLVICCISINLAFSAPEIVYRLDSRPPEVIFRDGFSSWGNNDNVIDHISGSSIHETRDSAFIATTALVAKSSFMAKRTFGKNPKAILYVYRIYTDDNFYSAAIALKYIFENPNKYSPKMVEDAQLLYKRTSGVEEWIAKSKINPMNIDSGVRVNWDENTKEVSIGKIYGNPNAKKPNTIASDAVYIGGSNTGVDNFYYVGDNKCYAFDLGFCPINADSKSQGNDFCDGLPIFSTPYDKPVASCQSFVNIQPAINLLFSHSSKPSPTTNPQYPWNTDTICVVAGFGAYDHVDCTSTNGVVNFSGNMGGLGGVGTYDGTMHFSNRYSSFTGKSCSITMDQEILHMHISIDCGGNYTASLSVWGIGAAGVMHGTGSFK